MLCIQNNSEREVWQFMKNLSNVVEACTVDPDNTATLFMS